MTEAESLFRRALKVDEQSLGPDHPNVAIDLNNLACLFQDTGRFAEADPVVRRALEIDEQCFGLDHPKIAIRLGNLAGLLTATDRLTEAEPLIRRALAILEKSLGANHPHVATALNNLAYLLEDLDRPAEAEPLRRRALEIFLASSRATGLPHPHLKGAVEDYISLRQAIGHGRDEVLVTLCELAPEFFPSAQKLSGPPPGAPASEVTPPAGAPVTAAPSGSNVSHFSTVHPQSDPEQKGESLLRQALARAEQTHGAEHPEVANALNSLAEFLRTTNRPKQAEPLYRRALAMSEQCLGPDHPLVATVLNNLSCLLQNTERQKEAEPLLRRVLGIFERKLGKNHPNVATTLDNLALLLVATARAGDAEPLLRRALAIDERSYGADHPNVTIRLKNLAELLMSAHQFAEAEPLLRRHVEILLKHTIVAGHSHADLRGTILSYAGVLQMMGRKPDQIRAHIQSVAARVAPGLDVESIMSESNTPPVPPKLRAVVEQLMRNPSKVEELTAQLAREDPELFMELFLWMKRTDSPLLSEE